MSIPDGYGFVSPRGRDIARALLDAADSIDVDQTLILTQADGYLAPEDVVKAYEATLGAPTEKGDEGMAPDSSWKNADIEKYAADHSIDLGGAVKKADMLSAISAATKEE